MPSVAFLRRPVISWIDEEQRVFFRHAIDVCSTSREPRRRNAIESGTASISWRFDAAVASFPCGSETRFDAAKGRRGRLVRRGKERVFSERRGVARTRLDRGRRREGKGGRGTARRVEGESRFESRRGAFFPPFGTRRDVGDCAQDRARGRSRFQARISRRVAGRGRRVGVERLGGAKNRGARRRARA